MHDKGRTRSGDAEEAEVAVNKADKRFRDARMHDRGRTRSGDADEAEDAENKFAKRNRVVKTQLTSDELKLLGVAFALVDESQPQFLRKAALDRANEIMQKPENAEYLKELGGQGGRPAEK